MPSTWEEARRGSGQEERNPWRAESLEEDRPCDPDNTGRRRTDSREGNPLKPDRGVIPRGGENRSHRG